MYIKFTLCHGAVRWCVDIDLDVPVHERNDNSINSLRLRRTYMYVDLVTDAAASSLLKIRVLGSRHQQTY